MDLGLTGKTVVVTGGGRGIGKEICLTFAREGANVVIADIDQRSARATAEEVKALGVESLGIALDVTDIEQANKMAEATMKKFGSVDILVNNAAIWIIKRFGESTKADWDKEINIDYYGVLNCTKALLGHMVERKTGVIINIGSDAGKIGEPLQPVYSGVKAAVIAFSKALAKDVGSRGIRVNAVCPSLTITPGAKETLSEEVIENVKKAYPLRKVGKPEDLANMVVFLASDRAGHVTGQAISVNGGYCTA